MTIATLHEFSARTTGAFRLSMTDGSLVFVATPRHMGMAPLELDKADTVVVYGRNGEFHLLDAALIATVLPVANGPDAA